MLALATSGIAAQPNGANERSGGFRAIVDARLKKFYGIGLDEVCRIDGDAVAERVFREYGAMYIAEGVKLPTKCIFESDAELGIFQRTADPQTESIGGVDVTLQRPAMSALLAARDDARRQKLDITPRGGATASTRSVSRTIELWKSRFEPGLNHWMQLGKIAPADAVRARRSTTREQVAMVLAWEQQSLWFSTAFDKSILYSVAAPGASQHNFMLALDVEQYGNAQVRAVLARHGWFQTIKSDLPHFTYLGVEESKLPSLGLRAVTVGGQRFWMPDLE